MGFLWSSLDESSDRLKRKTFVVAGYLARQDEWTDIERHWLRRLEQECDPSPMKYFSTSECNYLTGEFRRFRKFPKPKGREAANAVRNDLQMIMRSSSTIGLGLGIKLSEYRAIRKSSRARKALAADPYKFSYQMTMILIAGKCADMLPSTETIAFLCDNHNLATNVKDAYDKLKSSNPHCGSCMGSLTHMDNETSPALQAADLLAGRIKDYLIECQENPQSAVQIKEKYRGIIGKNVNLWKMDKRSLNMVVDANVLKNGKPSIYSTSQLHMLDELDNPSI
jgi:hypothetical protein